MRQRIHILLANILKTTLLVLFGWLRRISKQEAEDFWAHRFNFEGSWSPLGSDGPYKPILELSREKGFPQASSDLVGGVVQDWMREAATFLANQLSDNTRLAYQTDLRQFLGFLRIHLGITNIRLLSTQHVVLYRKYLEEGRITRGILAKSTVNRKLAVIKSFLNWLKAAGMLQSNPAERVKGYPQSQESALKGFSDSEVCQMLELPNRNSRTGSLHLAILYVLFFLGLRKRELTGLKIGDLSSERGIAVIKVRGKGHRIRILPLTPKVLAVLENYFLMCRRDREATEEPLFTPTKNPKGHLNRALHPYAITYIVSRYAKKAGVLKKVSPHSCRATCISNALDRRATHRSVQHLAGWSTPLMIQRYDKRREDLQNSAAYFVDYAAVN